MGILVSVFLALLDNNCANPAVLVYPITVKELPLIMGYFTPWSWLTAHSKIAP